MINYKPKLESELWAMKCLRTFDSIGSLMAFVAEKGTLFSHYIGRNNTYTQADVEIRTEREFDRMTGWENYCSVLLNGVVVGYCGE